MGNYYLLFECDLCHDHFDLQQIRLQKNGKEFLCDKCSKEYDLMDSLPGERTGTSLNLDCGVTIRPKGA